MTQNISAGILSNVIISVIFISALFLTISKAEFFSLNGLIFVVVAFIYLGILYQINTSKVTISKGGVSINGLIWSYTESKDNILDVLVVDELSHDDQVKYRNNGISLFSYKAGKFTLKSNSSAFLLSNGVGKYAVITTKNSKFDKIIFSFDEDNIDDTADWFHG